MVLGKRPMHEHIRRFEAGEQHTHDAHLGLVCAIQQLEYETQFVPMPHTSGLAWNRNAPNGRRWSAIGREQVELAVRLLRRVSHAY